MPKIELMSIMNILTYPDPMLRTIAKPVDNPADPKIQEYVQSMAETMYDAPGVGLAAPQVGISLRIAITDTGWRTEGVARELHVWINPEITDMEGEYTGEEGCLSVPDIYEDIQRAASITASWFDLEGVQHHATFEGFQAVALQHEFDHLDGKLFIDLLPPIKQKMLKKRLRKQKKLVK